MDWLAGTAGGLAHARSATTRCLTAQGVAVVLHSRPLLLHSLAPRLYPPAYTRHLLMPATPSHLVGFSNKNQAGDDSTLVYDVAANRWRRGATRPFPSGHHVAAEVVNRAGTSRLYLFGGLRRGQDKVGAHGSDAG